MGQPSPSACDSLAKNLDLEAELSLEVNKIMNQELSDEEYPFEARLNEND